MSATTLESSHWRAAVDGVGHVAESARMDDER
jgi:hypothetical protein